MLTSWVDLQKDFITANMQNIYSEACLWLCVDITICDGIWGLIWLKYGHLLISDD